MILECGLDAFISGFYQVAGYLEYSSEPPDFIKGGVFIEQHGDY
jgi:hypothetical protein